MCFRDDLWNEVDQATVARPESIEHLQKNGCPHCGARATRICTFLVGRNSKNTLTAPLSVTFLGSKMEKVRRGRNDAPRRGNTHRKKLKSYFLYTKRSCDKGVKNVACVASTILASSKVIFFDKINALLHCLSSSHAGLLYTDTDSIYFSLAKRDLADNCVSPSRRTQYLAWKNKIFADENSLISQHGKLGLESEHERGFFRSVKCKLLTDPLDSGEPQKSVTLKGLPRNIHAKVGEKQFMNYEHYKHWYACDKHNKRLWALRNDMTAVGANDDNDDDDDNDYDDNTPVKKYLSGLTEGQNIILKSASSPCYSAQFIKLRAMRSLTINLATDRRTVGSGLNLKRKMLVIINL